MATTSDSISLLFKARGDTDEAKKAFAQLAQQFGLSETSAKNLAGAMPIAGAAIAGLTAVVAGAAFALFQLTKNASEFGSEIFDASQKTGLGAETLSAMKFAADQAGTSLDTITSASAKFAKTIDEAANGSEKAQAKLARLGVTSKDLDVALGQALATIVKFPPGVEQMTAAQAAFGKSGADLLPFIKSFNGDLTELTARAKSLGVTLTDEAARASDEFGDTLETLSAQAAGLGRQFALELMPSITAAMASISAAMANNKGVAAEWGNALQVYFSDVGRGVNTLGSVLGAFWTNTINGMASSRAAAVSWSSVLFNSIMSLIPPLLFLQKVGEAVRLFDPSTNVASGTGTWLGPTVAPPKARGGPSGAPKGGGGDASAKKNTEEQRATAELRAQLELQKIALDELDDKYKTVMARIRAEFKKTGDDVAFINAANAANKELAQGLPAVINALDQLERKLLKDPTTSQIEVLNKQQAARRKELDALGIEDLEKNNALIADADQKLAEKRIEIAEKLAAELEKIRKDVSDQILEQTIDYYDEEIKNAQGSWEQQNLLRGQAYDAVFAILQAEHAAKLDTLARDEAAEKAKIQSTIKNESAKLEALAQLRDLYYNRELFAIGEFEKRKKEIEDQYAVPVPSGDEEPMGGFGGGFFGGLGTSVENALKPVETMLQFGQMLGQTFMQVAQAVGAAVKSFVLFGTAGGSFRKFAAEMLASIAQMAIVQAVFQLAQGFAMLALTWFTGDPKFAASAGFHFASAAAFGIIGGVAAIAGRATAGDSFKKESSGAFGTAGGGSSGGQGQRSGNGGSVFSSQGDTVVEESRNAPGSAGRGGILGAIQSHITLKIESTSAHIVEVVKENINNNGQLRTVIQDAT